MLSCCRVCAIVALSALILAAQSPPGSLRGSVLDSAGAAIAGARLTLSAAGESRVATTGATGEFTFNTVAPGEYQLRAEASGYAPVVRKGIALAAGGSVEVELRLNGSGPLDGPFQLKESMEVTATRTSIGTATSPVSSAVILRADMERRNIVTADQALTTAEGVYAYRQRGVPDNEVGIGMRGFSGRGTGQSRVLILLDGQPVNNSYTGAVNWTALPFSEVERVEVARGPFSSLYGGNAMGGVVNVITRPITQSTAEFAAQYGTYGTANYSGRVGTRFKEKLGVAFGFDGLRTDGYRSQEVLRTATNSTAAGGVQVTGVDRYLTRTGTVNYAVGMRGRNTYDRYALRGRAEYAFGARTFGSFQYLRQENSYGWGPYLSTVRAADGRILDDGNVVFLESGVWRRITLTPSNYLGVVGVGASNVYQGQLLTDRQGAGQWRFQGGWNQVPNDRQGAPGATATQAGGAGTDTLQSNRGGFANAQWTHTVRSRHTLAAGSDVRLDRATIGVFPTSEFLGGGRLGSRSTYTRGAAATWALYAQDQYAVTERLMVTFGGRYDSWRTYNGQSQAADAAPTVAFPDRSANAFTGKAAAVFTAPQGTVLRASAGSAFRTPSVFDLYRDLRLASGSLLLGNPNVNPERMRSWEFGLRQDAGRFVSTDLAYYENRIRDLIFRAVDPADPSGLTQRMLNAGRARSRGVEAALTVRPAGWLTLRPTYTFTDSRITRNDASPLTVGRRIPFVPRHVSGGTASAVFRRLTITGTGRYQSDVFAADTNNDTVKGVPGAYDKFLEVDSAVNFALTGRLMLTFTAENIFDRQYYLFYRNPGRTVAAGVRFRWNQGRP
jgi:iron complex outermembrane receptor protein